MLELFFEMIGALCDLADAISEYSGNKNDRGKGKHSSERYVTR